MTALKGVPGAAATINQPLTVTGRNINWDLALCKNHAYPDMFHPDGEDKHRHTVKEALDMCNRGGPKHTPCPIKTECFTYAYENKLDGIWGGTTSRHRNGLRKRKAQL